MALTKTLWTTITDMVTTGQEVSDALDVAFSNTDTAMDAIDTNTSDIATLQTLNDFSSQTVNNHTVVGDVFEAVTTYTGASKPAGTYMITLSMLYSLNSTTTAAFFRFTLDGGSTWYSVKREPKDNTDAMAMTYSFPYTHVSGDIVIGVESRKENAADILTIAQLNVMVDRKA